MSMLCQNRHDPVDGSNGKIRCGPDWLFPTRTGNRISVRNQRDLGTPEGVRTQRPSNSVASETFRASAIRIRCRIEGFRTPCSMPHMYVRCMPASSAKYSCDQPLACRSCRIRLPSDFWTASARFATAHVELAQLVKSTDSS